MPLFQFPPYVLVLIASAAITLGLGAYALYAKKGTVFFYFGISFLLAGLWPLLYSIELCLTNKELIETIARIKPLSVQIFPIFYIIFAFQLVQQKYPPKWMMYIMSAFALSMVIAMSTNGQFHIAWEKELFITTREGYNLFILIPGLWTKYTLIIYHYTADAIFLYLMIKGVSTQKYPYKIQYQLLILAMLISLFGSATYIFGLISYGPYNPTPGILGLTSALTAMAVFRYHMLSITPYARDTVYEIIDTPVIIADINDKLVDYNRSASETFKINEAMIGEKLSDIFNDINIDWESIKEETNSTIETRWGTGKNKKFSTNKRKISKGDLHGFLIIFADVTAQMEALNTKHEKEIVTYKESILGDMHDGIGGTVATAAIIAQTALEEEDNEAKNRMIGQIASLLENGSFELRSMLNILDKDKIDWQAMVSDMRSYSSTVLDSKEISRKFTVNGKPYSDQIDFDFYLSVFRLFKECITNIVKHSEAKKVDISISFDDDAFKFTINDDGKGIDEKNSSGYGIKNMTRRADKLGGSFEIASENGTTVNIYIPL